MALNVTISHNEKEATITLSGQLDAAAAPAFRDAVEQVFAHGDKPERLIVEMGELEYMASAGLRALVFAKQKTGGAVALVLAHVQESVMETIEMTGFHHSVEFL